MVAKTYSFVEQYEMGAEGEAVLDKYFEQWYDIVHATKGEQLGKKIDRWFRRKDEEVRTRWIAIEYKTDKWTDKTNNLFLETWSKYQTSAGWLYRTQADKVIYYALPDTIYILDRREFLLKYAEDLRQKYGEKPVKNVGYISKGIPVPVDVVVELIGKKNVRRLS